MDRVTLPASDERLDRRLTDYYGGTYSRSEIGRWFKEGRVLDPSGREAKPSERTEGPTELQVNLPEATSEVPQPQDLPLDIIYEDEAILVVHKPAGVVVHPGAGRHDDTLVNALLHYTDRLSEPPDAPERPGIVHRLDKDTSGLLVVARRDDVHRTLQRMFREHRVGRCYTALVEGAPDEPLGLVAMPIGRDDRDRTRMAVRPDGRPSRTLFREQAQLQGASLLTLRLITGRTHQIRVHMQAIGHPVLGDPVYGSHESPYGQALHAQKIVLAHPVTGEIMSFMAPWPERLRRMAAERGATPEDIERWSKGEGLIWPAAAAGEPDA